MKTALSLFALIAASAAFAQAEPQAEAPVKTEAGLVSISSKGADIRSVLFDMFEQSERSFVLDSGTFFALYLHLEGVEFQRALDIVVENAQIGYEVKNGVYFIGKNRPKPYKVVSAPVLPPALPKPEVKPEPKRLDPNVLQKRLTTRYSITPIKKVFEEFTRQTGVTIEVDESVPDYKLDAFLLDTSLKYALDVICDAAKLQWKFSDHETIIVTRKAN